VVICLERGADLHMAQLMPLPLTVSCFSKIQIGFYRAMLFIRGTSRRPVSLRVRPCLSVTSRSSTKTAERIGLAFGMGASFALSYTVL